MEEIQTLKVDLDCAKVVVVEIEALQAKISELKA